MINRNWALERMLKVYPALFGVVIGVVMIVIMAINIYFSANKDIERKATAVSESHQLAISYSIFLKDSDKLDEIFTQNYMREHGIYSVDIVGDDFTLSKSLQDARLMNMTYRTKRSVEHYIVQKDDSKKSTVAGHIVMHFGYYSILDKYIESFIVLFVVVGVVSIFAFYFSNRITNCYSESIGALKEALASAAGDCFDVDLTPKNSGLLGSLERAAARMLETQRKLQLEKKENLELLRLQRENADERSREAEKALSEMHKAKEAEKDALKRASEANEAKERFLATLNHEIRSPLSNIISLVMRSQRANAKESQASFNEKILSQAKDLKALVEGVLNYTKSNKGGFPVEIEQFDPSEALADLTDTFADNAAGAGINFTFNHINCSLGHQCKKVESDRTRIRQITKNFVDNAIKYTQKGGAISLTTRLFCLNENHSIFEIECRDSGVGIQEDKIAHVFDAFQQFEKATDKFSGVGLGLAFCKKLADDIGAKITCESEVGLGSVFRLKVNLNNVISRNDIKHPEEVEEAEAEEIEEVEGAKTSEIKYVLYVEDSKEQRENLKSILSSYRNIELHTSSTVDDGIELYKNNNYELIFLDIYFKQENGELRASGLDCARQIREIERKTGVEAKSIIALTSSSITDLEPRARDAGMNDILAKPADDASIAAKLVEHLC